MRVAVLLTVALMAVGFTSVRAQQIDTISYTVTIGSLNMDLGQEGPVELRIVDIAGEAGAWTIDLTYDPDIASVVECAAAGSSVCDADRTASSLRVTGAHWTGLVEDTTLADITFRCEEKGVSPLSVKVQILAIPELTIDVRTEDGAITCTPPRGDVNADGIVNSIDALWVLQSQVRITGFSAPY